MKYFMVFAIHFILNQMAKTKKINLVVISIENKKNNLDVIFGLQILK